MIPINYHHKAMMLAIALNLGAAVSNGKEYKPEKTPGEISGTPPNSMRRTKAQRKADKRARMKARNAT